METIDDEIIPATLTQIERRLNEWFLNIDHRDRPWVKLSSIVDNEGRFRGAVENTVVMFLANMQHETTISTFNRSLPISDDRYAIVTPPVYLNLYLLFYANFWSNRHQYVTGLGAISRTISYFQQHPTFTHDSLPELDPRIEKLTFELVNLDVTDLNYLIGLAGVKYLPLVLYKVRMIPFQAEAMKGQTPAVQGLESPGYLDEEVDHEPETPDSLEAED